ncbi:hypothetical protein HaLaN_08016 [Haematococcus lacustris]|uniref:Uncharacterized protein n=1 Tax=Haematococcus lacustris TaxID=44745 RepID=A0A699YR38_HAELA|nr:hypothetical protein HaLaN_08016 [Haematococcus lacustris]
MEPREPTPGGLCPTAVAALAAPAQLQLVGQAGLLPPWLACSLACSLALLLPPQPDMYDALTQQLLMHSDPMQPMQPMQPPQDAAKRLSGWRRLPSHALSQLLQAYTLGSQVVTWRRQEVLAEMARQAATLRRLARCYDLRQPQLLQLYAVLQFRARNVRQVWQAEAQRQTQPADSAAEMQAPHYTADRAPQLGVGVDCAESRLLAQIKDALDLLTNASVLEHLMRGPHHRGIKLLPGEVAVFEQPTVAKLEELDEEHLQGDILARKATWDALWEEYLKPRWRRQRLGLDHAQERVIERSARSKSAAAQHR